MKLKTEIAELKQQIEHFEGALSDLKTPSSQPGGNQLAQVLQARFERLDNEAERKRSLESAKSLLSESKKRLEQKEKELKDVALEVKNGVYRLNGHASRINQLSLRLKAEMDSFEAQAMRLKKKWPIVHDAPMVKDFDFNTTLPFVSKTYSSQHGCQGYRVSLHDSLASLPESDPFASAEHSLGIAPQ